MEVFRDIDQGSAEWFELRKGLPTASEFHKVMAKTGPRGGTSSKEYVMRVGYLRTLAGEIITGEVAEQEWAGNRHTDRGKEREDEARALYALMNGVEPERISFVRNGNCGSSPDSFVTAVGGLELKDVIAKRQIERLQDGTLPGEHKWQVIGSLLVCDDREWWDFVSHSRGLPLFEFRVYRDKVKAELAELREGVDKFCDERDKLVKWIGAMW
jgi:YqaJ-like viral recombinase domain